MIRESLTLILTNLFNINPSTILPCIFIALLSFITIIYSNYFYFHLKRFLCIIFASISSIFAILSDNLILTFISIELLSLFCFFLILFSNKIKRKIALSYFITHAFAGVLFIIFTMMSYYENNTFAIIKISNLLSLKAIILLISFLINTASIPFAGWYIKTYSKADSFSLLLLATITTKTSFFVFWNIISGSNVLFEIGVITLVIASISAMLTVNVIKFLLFTSVASMGFSIMSISYDGLLEIGSLGAEINYMLIWYIASGIFAISGFLILYGFIVNHEAKNYSFQEITKYFKEYGSSVHFFILAIIFGIYLSAFPLTTSFFVKNNISKFFVNRDIFYFTIKLSSIIFVMFALKLVLPVCHSVEFFKLDSKGRKLISVCYANAFTLICINIVFVIFFKPKFSFFTFSVDFFSFVAYGFCAGVLLFFLNYLFKITKLKLIIYYFSMIKRHLMDSIVKTISRLVLKNHFGFLLRNYKKLNKLTVYSNFTLSTSMILISCFITIFLTRI